MLNLNDPKISESSKILITIFNFEITNSRFIKYTAFM